MNANTAESLGYKDGDDGRCRQEDERAGVTFWDGGSPSWTRFELWSPAPCWLSRTPASGSTPEPYLGNSEYSCNA